MQKTARLKKLARHLLASTCLTVAAAGTAYGSTFNESSDFSNAFGTADILPVGTDTVIGHIGFGDADDYFEFTGLLGGATFFLGASTDGNSFNPFVTVLSNSPSTITGPLTFSFGSPTNGSGVIPADGILVFHVGNPGEGGTYTVTLDAPLAGVPEPGTLTGVGLGLAGALALRRRSKA
jgi:hypothetical protein